MKKMLFIPVISLLFLTGCFGSGEEKTTAEPLSAEVNSFQNDQFSISPPKNWETVQTFTQEYPEGVVVAFRNNVKSDLFTANISIYKKKVATNHSSIDFALETLKLHETQLLNYHEIARELTKITVAGKEEDTMLISFEGKQNPEEIVTKFLQIFAVKGETGFSATAAFAQDEEEITIKEAEKALRSLIIKE